jgi:hypothetical protein
VDYSDGTRQLVELLDQQGLQVIQRPDHVAPPQWIKLVILSVYPSYKWSQAALSEARVYEAVQ